MSYRKHLMTSDEPPSELYKAAEVGTNLASLGTDCISRRQAIDIVEFECGEWSGLAKTIAEEIKQLPPVQPEPLQPWEVLVAQAVLPQPAEPKRGRWIRTGSGSLYDHYECSECGKPPKWECMGDNRWKIAFTDFCPNCGAKMRGEQDG